MMMLLTFSYSLLWLFPRLLSRFEFSRILIKLLILLYFPFSSPVVIFGLFLLKSHRKEIHCDKLFSQFYLFSIKHALTQSTVCFAIQHEVRYFIYKSFLFFTLHLHLLSVSCSNSYPSYTHVRIFAFFLLSSSTLWISAS